MPRPPAIHLPSEFCRSAARPGRRCVPLTSFWRRHEVEFLPEGKGGGVAHLQHRRPSSSATVTSGKAVSCRMQLRVRVYRPCTASTTRCHLGRWEGRSTASRVIGGRSRPGNAVDWAALPWGSACKRNGGDRPRINVGGSTSVPFGKGGQKRNVQTPMTLWLGGFLSTGAIFFHL